MEAREREVVGGSGERIPEQECTEMITCEGTQTNKLGFVLRIAKIGRAHV